MGEQVKQWIPPLMLREALAHIHTDLTRDIPFLRGMDSSIAGMLFDGMKHEEFAEKECIIVRKQVIESIRIIKEGVVSVIDAYGLVVKTFEFGGSFFAENCIDKPNCRSDLSYRAFSDVEIFSIHRDQFLRVLDAYPRFKKSFRALCKERSMHDRQVSLQRKDSMIAVKQVGMKERPSTPPPGVHWLDSDKIGEIREEEDDDERDDDLEPDSSLPN